MTMRDVTAIISPVLWTLLTASIAVALTLSALALRQDSASEPNFETKRAVDCYALMEAAWDTPEDTAEREAVYVRMDDRGCWP